MVRKHRGSESRVNWPEYTGIVTATSTPSIGYDDNALTQTGVRANKPSRQIVVLAY